MVKLLYNKLVTLIVTIPKHDGKIISTHSKYS